MTRMTQLLDAWVAAPHAIRIALLALIATVLTCGIALFAGWLARSRPARRHAILLGGLVVILVIPALSACLAVSGAKTLRISLPRELSRSLERDARSPGSERLTPTTPLPPNGKGNATQIRDPQLPLTEPVHAPQPAHRLVTADSTVSTSISSDHQDNQQHSQYALLTVLLAVWIAGSSYLLVRLLRCAVRIHSLCSGRGEDVPTRLITAVERNVTVQQLKRFRLRTSPQIPGPLAAGVWRPTILLPEHGWDHLSDQQLQDVLSHEAAHLLRRDPLVALLQQCATILFWFVPPLYWLNRQLTQAREEICDNYVLRKRDPLQYGETLFTLARLATTPPTLVGTVGILPKKGQLERRVVRLLDPRRDNTTRANPALIAVATTGLLMTSAVICGADVTPETDAGKTSSEVADEAAKAPQPSPPAAVPPPQRELERALYELVERIEAAQPKTRVIRHIENGHTVRLGFKNARLTQDDFRLIGKLPQLSRLELSGSNVTDADLQHLSGLQNLEELELWGTAIHGRGLAHLYDCPKLERLNLGDTKVDDASLAQLQGLAALRYLNLQRNKIGDDALAQLADLTQLKALQLCECNITDVGLQQLEQLLALRSITLHDTKVTSAGLTFLASFPELEWMDNPRSVVEAFARRIEAGEYYDANSMRSIGLSIPERGKFETIEVIEHPLSDTDRKRNRLRFELKMHWYMNNNESDESLLLQLFVRQGTIGIMQAGIVGSRSSQVTPKEVAWFLKFADRFAWPADVGEEPASRVERNAQGGIRALHLCGVKLGHRHVELVAGLKELEVLNLARTDVHWLNVQEISTLPKLRVLNLDHTHMFDRGIPFLIAMPRLEEVSLKQVRVTAGGIEELKEARPDLKFEYSQRPPKKK